MGLWNLHLEHFLIHPCFPSRFIYLQKQNTFWKSPYDHHQGNFITVKMQGLVDLFSATFDNVSVL